MEGFLARPALTTNVIGFHRCLGYESFPPDIFCDQIRKLVEYFFSCHRESGIVVSYV